MKLPKHLDFLLSVALAILIGTLIFTRQSTTQIAISPGLLSPAPTNIVSYPPPNPTPLFTLVIPPSPLPPPPPTPEATDTPLPPTPPATSNDIIAIQEVIQRAYHLRAVAARTFDTSQFHTVYTNDSQTRLAPEYEAFVRATAVPLVGPRMPVVASPPGALDYFRAYFAYWQLGAERLQQRQLGTPVSAREGPVGPGPRDDPISAQPRLDFKGIWVTGNRAEAVVDSPSVLERYYLVKTPEGWRISRQDVLRAHF